MKRVLLILFILVLIPSFVLAGDQAATTGKSDITENTSNNPNLISGGDNKTVSQSGQTAIPTGMDGNTAMQVYQNYINSFRKQESKGGSGAGYSGRAANRKKYTPMDLPPTPGGRPPGWPQGVPGGHPIPSTPGDGGGYAVGPDGNVYPVVGGHAVGPDGNVYPVVGGN